MPRKLLLADDSVTIQRVIELTFADEDIEVLAVGDGQQAIDRAERDRPDIVLADVGMPERDGYEVAAFIKGHPALAHVPVVLLTGAFEPIDETRARAVGCDGVLVKPFEPQMVINRVKDLLAGKRSANPFTHANPAPPPAATTGTAPEAGGTPAASGDSLEAYFDRLDAAFAEVGTDGAAVAPPAAPAAGAPRVPASVPSKSAAPPPARGADDLAGWDPDLAGDPVRPAAPVVATPAPAPVPRPAPAPIPVAHQDAPAAAPAASPAAAVPPPSLVEAFAALLAAEPRAGDIAPSAIGAHARSTLDADTIDEIARRVLAHLNGDTLRPIVLDVTERIVREEIERLKAGS
ncbi:MAG TPA: response regulator [Vicinamibacterales bacterium]|nr:response regulator [Vicinamibacterales bacterium]